MEVQKMSWVPNTIVKTHCGHQSNDCFCGFENIQSAMSCSGILGGGIHGAIYGRGDSGFGVSNEKSESHGTRTGGITGNIGSGNYSNLNQAFGESFIRDGMQKCPSGYEGPYSLFSSLETRNPLLESIAVNHLQNSEVSDGGQFSPSGGRNSGMRQNLDELVSKILDEDSSQSGRQLEDPFCSGADDKKFSHGLLNNSDYNENVRKIWSFDGKLPRTTQTQQNPLNHADQFKIPLDNHWHLTRMSTEKAPSQNTTTSAYQLVDNSVFPVRKPAYGVAADNNQFLQTGSHKFDVNGAATYNTLVAKTSSMDMEMALRCLEKSVPLTSPHCKPSEAQFNNFNAWSKMSNACSSSQNLDENQGLPVNCFQAGNSTSLPVANFGPAMTGCDSQRPDIKGAVELFAGLQACGTAKQYLARCFPQPANSEELRENQLEVQHRQLLKTLQSGADVGQNLLVPGTLKVSAERNPVDQSVSYTINKTAPATVRNGHNIPMYPGTKYPLWSSATVPSDLIQSSTILNALTGEKKDSDVTGLPPSGNPLIDQNQQFSYGHQQTGKKPGSYMSPTFVQGMSVPLPPDVNQCSDNIWCHVQDVPMFQAESLYQNQQPANGSGGGGAIQFDFSGMSKAAPQSQVPIRGMQSPWVNSSGRASDGYECGSRCDVHNIGRATPVILRPGEIFYNNVHPQTVFGLSQYMPDVKFQRCLSSSSNLLICLEECFEQLRNLEKEGKEVETELMQHSIGKCLVSVSSTAIPRLPNNPSRVNRLVVESLREHSKVITILGKLKKIKPLHANIYSAMETWMEGIRKVQARRKEEIVSSANRSNSGGSRAQEEKDILALTVAVEELLNQTRRARTCLWCAVQVALYGGSSSPEKGPAESCGGGATVYGLMNDWCLADGGAYFSGGGVQNGLKIEN